MGKKHERITSLFQLFFTSLAEKKNDCENLFVFKFMQNCINGIHTVSYCAFIFSHTHTHTHHLLFSSITLHLRFPSLVCCLPSRSPAASLPLPLLPTSDSSSLPSSYRLDCSSLSSASRLSLSSVCRRTISLWYDSVFPSAASSNAASLVDA